MWVKFSSTTFVITMTRKKLRKIFSFKRLFLTIIVLWTSSLVFFFSAPDWSQLQLTRAYNYLTNKKFIKSKPLYTCLEEQTHAWQMMDSTEQYLEQSFEKGIGKNIRFQRDIQPYLENGKLVGIEPTTTYSLDTMWYSYCVAVPETKQFLDTLGSRFQKKLTNTNLAHTKLLVTSLFRTESSVKRLLTFNRNAIKNSAHLHGTTFDVSYVTYDFNRELSGFEVDYLKEILALTLFELRCEKKCWVTYEIFQTCFHVVTSGKI